MNKTTKTINLTILVILLLVGSAYSQNKTGVRFLPKSSGSVIHHGDYSLAYSEEHEQAYWVSYELTKSEVLGSTKRKDNFREDPLVKTGSATLADYRNSGYDRGHLKPAADSKEDALEMSESFYMSNISPQDPKFNRGIWKELEELIRGWSIQEDTVYVITGPVILADKGGYKLPKIGKSGVSVPTHFYKIVLDLTGKKKKAIAFLMPNRPSSDPLVNFTVSIDSLEVLTGINFFHELPNNIEDYLEKSVQADKWSFKPFNLDKYKHQNDATIGSNTKHQTDVKPQKATSGSFTVNKNSGVRHNSSCKAFNCKNCQPSDGNEGRACKLCGG